MTTMYQNTKTNIFLQQKKEMEKWCNYERFRLCNCNEQNTLLKKMKVKSQQDNHHIEIENENMTK
jgi:hypothetical protein